MNNNFKSLLIREVKSLFELKKTERLWHIPVLASLCVGLPLLIGYYLGKVDYGTLSAMLIEAIKEVSNKLDSGLEK